MFGYTQSIGGIRRGLIWQSSSKIGPGPGPGPGPEPEKIVDFYPVIFPDEYYVMGDKFSGKEGKQFELDIETIENINFVNIERKIMKSTVCNFFDDFGPFSVNVAFINTDASDIYIPIREKTIGSKFPCRIDVSTVKVTAKKISTITNDDKEYLRELCVNDIGFLTDIKKCTKTFNKYAENKDYFLKNEIMKDVVSYGSEIREDTRFITTEENKYINDGKNVFRIINFVRFTEAKYKDLEIPAFGYKLTKSNYKEKNKIGYLNDETFKYDYKENIVPDSPNRALLPIFTEGDKYGFKVHYKKEYDYFYNNYIEIYNSYITVSLFSGIINKSF